MKKNNSQAKTSKQTESLLAKVHSKKAKVAIVGVGYVGLPVAAMLAQAGFAATGVDVNVDRIDKLKRGGNPIEGNEPGLNELLAQACRTGRLQFTTSSEVYRSSDIILIAVETPVEDGDHKPKYKALRSAVEAIAKQVKSEKSKVKSKEVMVIVESTIAPGTINNIVRPTLEKITGRKEGKDLFVINCPERLMPGFLIKKIRHHSRVVGAASKKAAKIANEFYRNIIAYQPKHPDFQWRGEIDVATNLEAEIVKTAENAHRDVQIAFANELAWICEEYGADFWRVRHLVRKSPERNIHEAGAGVGGHCIPKDSWLLLASVLKHHKHSVIAHARHLNDEGPHHIYEFLKQAAHENKLSMKKIRVAVMGVTYNADSDDTRNAPTDVLIKLLKKAGVHYHLHDPYVSHLKKMKAESILKSAQAAIFMVAHSKYRGLQPKKIAKQMKAPKIIIDGRNIFSREKMESAGLKYWGVGNKKCLSPNI